MGRTSSLNLSLFKFNVHSIQALDSRTFYFSPHVHPERKPVSHFRIAFLSNRNVTAARMKLLVPVSTLRPATFLTGRLSIAPLVVRTARNYANVGGSGPSSAASKRRAVTPFNDDGHVPWGDLSVAEKSARAAQQTFNLGFIVVGVVLTV